MVDIRWKTYEINGVYTVVDSDRILCLNEKHIEEGLDHKNLRVITVKYPSGYRKHRYELVDMLKQLSRTFIRKVLDAKVKMGP